LEYLSGHMCSPPGSDGRRTKEWSEIIFLGEYSVNIGVITRASMLSHCRNWKISSLGSVGIELACVRVSLSISRVLCCRHRWGFQWKKTGECPGRPWTLASRRVRFRSKGLFKGPQGNPWAVRSRPTMHVGPRKDSSSNSNCKQNNW